MCNLFDSPIRAIVFPFLNDQVGSLVVNFPLDCIEISKIVPQSRNTTVPDVLLLNQEPPHVLLNNSRSLVLQIQFLLKLRDQLDL